MFPNLGLRSLHFPTTGVGRSHHCLLSPTSPAGRHYRTTSGQQNSRRHAAPIVIIYVGWKEDHAASLSRWIAPGILRIANNNKETYPMARSTTTSARNLIVIVGDDIIELHCDERATSVALLFCTALPTLACSRHSLWLRRWKLSEEYPACILYWETKLFWLFVVPNGVRVPRNFSSSSMTPSVAFSTSA